jgi:hypothetical protein
MNKEELKHLNDLKIYYQQLHLTVIYEFDFIKKLGSYRDLIQYRDDILDKINEKRRILKYI